MNKISRQLINIAKIIQAEDEVKHTFGQLATWIFTQGAQPAFSAFLNKLKLKRQDLQCETFSIDLNKKTIQLFLQFEPKDNKKLSISSKEVVEKTQGIYSGNCQLNDRNGCVDLTVNVDTNKFLPLLRSAGDYNQQGNLTDQSVQNFKKALMKQAKQQYGWNNK